MFTLWCHLAPRSRTEFGYIPSVYAPMCNVCGCSHRACRFLCFFSNPQLRACFGTLCPGGAAKGKTCAARSTPPAIYIVSGRLRWNLLAKKRTSTYGVPLSHASGHVLYGWMRKTDAAEGSCQVRVNGRSASAAERAQCGRIPSSSTSI